MSASAEVPTDDRVLPCTRGLSLFVVPFLLVAWVILYLFPAHTARLWAWPVQVTMTSMVLMLITAVRASDEMLPGRLLAWPLLVGVLMTLAGSAYLWAAYEYRPRHLARTAAG
jgi:hypothetical protein